MEKRKTRLVSFLKYLKILFLIIIGTILLSPWKVYSYKNSEQYSIYKNFRNELLIFYLLLFGVLCLALLYLNNIYKYWYKVGVSCSRPSLIVGHTLRRFGITMHLLKFYEDVYYNYNGRDFSGFYEFLTPGIIVGNLELIRNITVKDFHHFSHRRVLPMDKINPVANKMLSNATGKEWRQTRSAISPVFSSSKIKQLYPLVCQQADEFIKMLHNVGGKQKEIEIRDLCGQFTMDTIASCAFGIECDAMNSDRATFAKMAAKIFVLSPARAVKIITLLTAPILAQWTQRLGIEFASDEFHFFHKVVTKTLSLRAEKGIRRGDFLDLMRDTNKLCETTMTAQAVLFLLAGHNNIASALSFTLHLLAMHPEIQDALRKKLIEANQSENKENCIDCETLLKIPLLDGVVKESLRLYPTDPTMERICTKDYQIPGTKVVIRESQKVIIPIWCIHRDPSHWDDPLSFKPERFQEIQEKDPAAFLPFGVGPRQCIGTRFVYLVVKVGLHKILTNFKVIPTPNTVHPPPLSPKCFLSLIPVTGLPLAIVPLTEADM